MKCTAKSIKRQVTEANIASKALSVGLKHGYSQEMKHCIQIIKRKGGKIISTWDRLSAQEAELVVCVFLCMIKLEADTV